MLDFRSPCYACHAAAHNQQFKIILELAYGHNDFTKKFITENKQ